MMANLMPSRPKMANPIKSRFATRQVRIPRLAAIPNRQDESPEQALERRLRESQRVEERVQEIYNATELTALLSSAGSRLVVLEFTSDEVCQTGLEEEVEVQWKLDQSSIMAPCRNVKHAFQRCARDCPDALFLECKGDATLEGRAVMEQCNVSTLPTVQFYRDGRLLWSHRGVLAHDEALGEGMLYFGDTAAHGQRASEHVKELRSVDELRHMVSGAPSDALLCVDVSISSATPCIRVFPAVLALAKNFTGYATFARLLADAEGGEEATRRVLNELGVTDVPTFLFYRGGKEIHRFVGSSRSDLLGQVLGLMPVPPPSPPRPKAAASTKKVGQR